MDKTVGVVSLGCAKNLVDTERMLGILTRAGYQVTNDPAEARVLIVNTCGFIEPAKQESIDTLLELAAFKNGGRCETLVATGCLSQRYREELTEAMPEIDILLGVREYEKLPALLAKREGSADPAAALANPGNAFPVPAADARRTVAPRVLATPAHRAFLRIADGCDNRCAYCAIPLIRGGLVSEPMEKLIAEAESLADGGVTELTLIAQDTSCYGVDLYGRPRLPELLERLCDIPPLRWIRVLYTYPDTVTPQLLDTLSGNEKLVRYLDMPLQHISDTLLARMNRRGSKEHIRGILEYIRLNAPDFILRTTMMVGFPGETEGQFAELLAFLREYPFDRVGTFEFSPEEGTRAACLADQVDAETKRRRYDALMAQQRGISARLAQKRVGGETELLIEGIRDGFLVGRTRAEAPDVDGLVRVPFRPGYAVGQYARIRLTGALDYDMIGELL